jgi:hypothetical protein
LIKLTYMYSQGQTIIKEFPDTAYTHYGVKAFGERPKLILIEGNPSQEFLYKGILMSIHPYNAVVYVNGSKFVEHIDGEITYGD